MNIHMHLASAKSPWFGEGSGAPRSVPHPRLAQGWGRDSSPQGPGLCLAALCASRSTSENQVWIIPAQDILSPSSPCPTVSMDHCSSNTTGAVWGTGWAASACSGQNQNQLDNWDSCQHRTQSANIQAIFLMFFSFFLMPWKEDEGFKPTMKCSLFHLGQCSSAWEAEAPGGQAEPVPFWWVQSDFLTPSDHQSNCSSSPAVAIWEFAVLPFQDPFGSNTNGDLLWKEDATCDKGLINLQWGHMLTSLCGTLETSPFKISKEPCDVEEWITLPGLLGSQFWTSQKEKLFKRINEKAQSKLRQALSFQGQAH